MKGPQDLWNLLTGGPYHPDLDEVHEDLVKHYCCMVDSTLHGVYSVWTSASYDLEKAGEDDEEAAVEAVKTAKKALREAEEALREALLARIAEGKRV